MRIAQVAPLYESVPPRLYGGTERVVSYLTEALVALGHEVTLFASADSSTAARLISAAPAALRLNPKCVDPLAWHFLLLQEVIDRHDEFDVIHYHIDYLHFPISNFLRTPRVTTLHGRLDLPDLGPLYAKFRHEPLVSISYHQRQPLRFANWVANVYHGLPLDLHAPVADKQPYLVFVGRLSPEKRVDRAVEIARRAGLPLKIAAKIDKADQEYFNTRIKHLFELPGIEYLGELGDADKSRLLGEAMAMLFPIDWPEPFGLAMIEAMACGTPVIAFRCGSVPEVVDHGVSGFVVDSIESAVEAVDKAASLDPLAIRRHFETRFHAQRMAEDYVRLYQTLLAGAPQKSGDPALTAAPDEVSIAGL